MESGLWWFTGLQAAELETPAFAFHFLELIVIKVCYSSLPVTQGSGEEILNSLSNACSPIDVFMPFRVRIMVCTARALQGPGKHWGFLCKLL